MSDAQDNGIDADTDRISRVLTRLEPADFERFDPPLDLWDRIEASISSPKQAPRRDMASGTVIEYRIDANDVVTEVGQNWADFARDNDAPELALPAGDRTLWTYFGRDEIRELWQILVERVRTSQTAAQIPFRCDAADTRRWFEMTVTPEPDAAVHFRSVLVFEESRPPVALLDPHSARDEAAEAVALCSWCGRGQHGSLWLDIEELVRAARLLERVSMPPISYGICAACRDEMSADLLVAGESNS